MVEVLEAIAAATQQTQDLVVVVPVVIRPQVAMAELQELAQAAQAVAVAVVVPPTQVKVMAAAGLVCALAGTTKGAASSAAQSARTREVV